MRIIKKRIANSDPTPADDFFRFSSRRTSDNVDRDIYDMAMDTTASAEPPLKRAKWDAASPAQSVVLDCDDMTKLIIEFLDLKSCLTEVKLVNKRWNGLATNTKRIRKYTLREADAIALPPHTVVSMLAACKELRFDFSIRPYPAWYIKLVDAFPVSVVTSVLVPSPNMELSMYKLLTDFAVRAKSVETLVINSEPHDLVDVITSVAGMPRLTSLVCPVTKNATPCAEILAQLGKLRKLHLQVPDSTDHEFNSVPISIISAPAHLVDLALSVESPIAAKWLDKVLAVLRTNQHSLQRVDLDVAVSDKIKWELPLLEWAATEAPVLTCFVFRAALYPELVRAISRLVETNKSLQQLSCFTDVGMHAYRSAENGGTFERYPYFNHNNNISVGAGDVDTLMHALFSTRTLNTFRFNELLLPLAAKRDGFLPSVLRVDDHTNTGEPIPNVQFYWDLLTAFWSDCEQVTEVRVQNVWIASFDYERQLAHLLSRLPQLAVLYCANRWRITELYATDNRWFHHANEEHKAHHDDEKDDGSGAPDELMDVFHAHPKWYGISSGGPDSDPSGWNYWDAGAYKRKDSATSICTLTPLMRPLLEGWLGRVAKRSNIKTLHLVADATKKTAHFNVHDLHTVLRALSASLQSVRFQFQAHEMVDDPMDLATLIKLFPHVQWWINNVRIRVDLPSDEAASFIVRSSDAYQLQLCVDLLGMEKAATCNIDAHLIYEAPNISESENAADNFFAKWIVRMFKYVKHIAVLHFNAPGTASRIQFAPTSHWGLVKEKVKRGVVDRVTYNDFDIPIAQWRAKKYDLCLTVRNAFFAGEILAWASFYNLRFSRLTVESEVLIDTNIVYVMAKMANSVVVRIHNNADMHEAFQARSNRRMQLANAYNNSQFIMTTEPGDQSDIVSVYTWSKEAPRIPMMMAAAPPPPPQKEVISAMEVDSEE
jgi:hypothetical protein